MRLSRITSWRLTSALASGTASAALLLACTLTQSLDYLQKGDGGGLPVVIEAGDSPNGEAGVDGGGRMPVWQVSGQTKPELLALDGQSLYWVADGQVFSVPKATGGTPKLLGAVPPATSALTADEDPAGFVFAAVGTDVLRFPKDGSGSGGAGVKVFAPGAGATIADAIGADDASLFVLQYDPSGAGVDARILRMAKDGGAPTDISGDGGATTMTIDPTNLLWLSGDPGTSAFIQHAKTAPAGTDSAIFALGPSDNLPALASDIAVDGANLYWLTVDGASAKALIVSRKRQAAASVVTIYLGTPDDTLGKIAVDSAFVYALDTHASALLRIAKGGGERENLLTGLKQPTSLVVDETGIYLSDAVSGMNGVILKFGK
jgi:hypothetical protein